MFPFRHHLMLLGFALAIHPAARAEDEEPNPKKPVKKIVVPEDDATGGGLAIPDLVRAAAAAKDPVIQGLFQTFSVPFDRVTDTRGVSVRVLPLPLLFSKDRYPDPYGVSILDNANKPSDTIALSRALTRSVEPYEQLALAAIETLLNPPKSTAADRIPALPVRLAAAERLLTQVLFFHESAIEQRKRTGKNWEPLKTQLDEKLTAIRLESVKQAALQKQWPRLQELVERYAQRYRSHPKVLQPMFAARLAEAEDLVQSFKFADLERARELLLDYESRFPNEPTDQSRRLKAALGARARQFLADAEKLMLTNPTEARNILRAVESFDTGDDERLRKLQQQLKAGYAVLVIGTRRMPERLTPATARWESEHQAVDLLFEGLLEPTPDEQLGVWYRPGMIAGKPLTSALAREVMLAERITWTLPEAGPFDTADLLAHLKLLAEKRHLPQGDLIDWFDDPILDPSDPARVKVRFKTGHPDPRELLALKLLPGRWLESKNKGLDDLDFATRPFGTGPFKLSPTNRTPQPGQPSPDVAFVANAAYARRNGKFGQPAIKEVRYVPLETISDPLAELRGERLHILTDIPTRDLDRYTTLPQVTVATPSVNRRLFILAINHRVPTFQNVDLRMALSQAIDREAILNEVFRGSRKEFHKALSGPFPADSWLTPRPNGLPGVLFNRDVAAAKLAQTRTHPDMKILHANDDPLAREACERIKKHLEEIGSADTARITVALEAVPPQDLYHRVYQEHRFELAYLPLEYSSDLCGHALAGWLDPAAGVGGGRNIGGYLVKETNPGTEDERFGKLLMDLRASRDPERIKTLGYEAHKRFNERVPFVPLWQLDSHCIFSNRLKLAAEGRGDPLPPRLLTPARMFNTIARWRLD